jgi:hypothetical protein
VNINCEHADVEDLIESDLIGDEDEDESFPGLNHDPQFFIKYVELSKIMHKIISMQRSPLDTLDIHAAKIAHCEIALHEWLTECPKSFVWDGQNQDIWSAILTSCY